MFPAREGDCLWIEYGDEEKPHRLLIDGGRKVAYSTIKERVAGLDAKERLFDLAVLTHVDADHIEGLLEMMADKNRGLTFRDVWFNGYHHLDPANFADGADDLQALGSKQGETFSQALVNLQWPWNKKFSGRPVVIPEDGTLPVFELKGGMKLTLLSPTWQALKALRPTWKAEVEKAGLVPGVLATPDPESDEEEFGALTKDEVERLATVPFKSDTSDANRSSIAFLAEYRGKRALFTGDAHADVIEKSLRRLQEERGETLDLDAFKISHHGSKGTVSPSLIKLVKCPIYLISTNGSRYGHPNPEAIARIVKFAQVRKEIVFNYGSKSNKPWNQTKLKQHFSYTTRYPTDPESGVISVNLL